MKRAIVLGIAVVGAAGVAAPSYGAWSTSGSGSAAALAEVMPKGSQPTVAGSGTTVRVSWTAVKMSGGDAVAGYVVSRYNATNGTPATVTGACAGVVTTTSCSETGVPAGTWVYTDRPVENNWNGAESSNSATVTVT
jgi:hypothetical protein